MKVHLSNGTATALIVPLFLCLIGAIPLLAYEPEKILSYQFPNDLSIKVHYTDSLSLNRPSSNPSYPRRVLRSAIFAYKKITQKYHFNTPGYSLSHPNPAYSKIHDRSIHILIGGERGPSTHETPYFDVVTLNRQEYEPLIILPSDYEASFQEWDRFNPPKGERNLEKDLRGTLFHEMLHVVLYGYNKNLKGFDKQKIDWYVEGLARYFELLGKADEDFFSEGFRKILNNKVRFSRGGVNYTMRFPDQHFFSRRYDSALFWKFIDERYGMEAIEHFSREVRTQNSLKNTSLFVSALEKVLNKHFRDILMEYAYTLYRQDLTFPQNSSKLSKVASSTLYWDGVNLFQQDGHGNLRQMGPVCRTDWIGEWEDKKAEFGDLSVAGDLTQKSDLESWGSDFFKIRAAFGAIQPFKITFLSKTPQAHLGIQIIISTQGVDSRHFKSHLILTDRSSSAAWDFSSFLKEENLHINQIRELELIITELGGNKKTSYEFSFATVKNSFKDI